MALVNNGLFFPISRTSSSLLFSCLVKPSQYKTPNSSYSTSTSYSSWYKSGHAESPSLYAKLRIRNWNWPLLRVFLSSWYEKSDLSFLLFDMSLSIVTSTKPFFFPLLLLPTFSWQQTPPLRWRSVLRDRSPNRTRWSAVRWIEMAALWPLPQSILHRLAVIIMKRWPRSILSLSLESSALLKSGRVAFNSELREQPSFFKFEHFL